MVRKIRNWTMINTTKTISLVMSMIHNVTKNIWNKMIIEINIDTTTLISVSSSSKKLKVKKDLHQNKRALRKMCWR